MIPLYNENRQLDRKFVVCSLIVGRAGNGIYLQSIENGRDAWESSQSYFPSSCLPHSSRNVHAVSAD